MQAVQVRPRPLVQVFETFGVRFAVRLGEAEPLEALPHYLPFGSIRLEEEAGEDQTFFAVRRSPDRRSWRVFEGRRRVVESPSLVPALERLYESLLHHVSCHARLTLVHAGAVGWKDRALIIPGNSFSGKSTLVRRLVEAGATYYSDDIAVVDGDGRLYPYARTLRFREPGTHVQSPIPLSVLGGGRSVPQPAPVRLVAFSRFDEKGSWECEELSPGNCVMEGLRHTLAVRSSPERHLQTWATLAGSGKGFRWKRGEATEAAARLLEALENGSVPA